MSKDCQISAVYPRLLLRSGLFSQRLLLHATGITKTQLESAIMIDWNIMATMLHNVNREMTIPEWTAHLGTRFGISTHGALGFAALSAPNLYSAYKVICECLAVRTTAITSTLSFQERRLMVRLHDRAGDHEAFSWLCQMILKNFEVLAETLLGQGAEQRIQIFLAQPRPEGYRKLAQAYRSKLFFSADHFGIELPGDLAHQPSVLHDESIYRSSIEKCVDILARRAEHFSAAASVKRALQKYFDDAIEQRAIAAPPPGLEELANGLHLSSRTLIRRLDAEQTSYKQILAELRRDYACSLLCDARLTVADVGERLGYREPANFGRAFKGWFGTSPAAWRREGGNG